MSGEKESKKEASSSSDLLNLKVVGQDGQVVQFKIKRSTPLRKLMAAFCDRQKIVQSTVRFVFDGDRVRNEDTPKSLDMDEGDTIEVFSYQTGGGQKGWSEGGQSVPGSTVRKRKRRKE